MAMADGLNLSGAATTAELFFPTEERVGESKRHLKLRTLLYQVLGLTLADRAAVGCDQFVYRDPTNPKVGLAPDAFVRPFTPSRYLPGHWLVHDAPGLGPTMRLTPAEQHAKAAEQHAKALQRVLELEAELKRRGNG
jgi:hypothetical protein